MEHEIDPLAVRTSVTRYVEEEKPLSEEFKLFNLCSTQIKAEFEDHSCNVISDIKLEEIRVPNNFPMLKYEIEGDSCDLVTMKNELKQEVTVEEDEAFTESFWNMGENETPEAKRPSNESCPSGNPMYESAQHPQLLRRNKNLQSSHAHSDTDSGSLKFDICRKIVPFAYNPGMHHSSHIARRKFKCEICEKCFARSVTLMDHARTHTGEKPLQCDVCEKRFAAARLLAAHVLTHRADKPYECDVCRKRFSQKRSLKIHLRKHMAPSHSNSEHHEKHSSLSL